MKHRFSVREFFGGLLREIALKVGSVPLFRVIEIVPLLDIGGRKHDRPDFSVDRKHLAFGAFEFEPVGTVTRRGLLEDIRLALIGTNCNVTLCASIASISASSFTA